MEYDDEEYVVNSQDAPRGGPGKSSVHSHVLPAQVRCQLGSLPTFHGLCNPASPLYVCRGSTSSSI